MSKDYKPRPAKKKSKKVSKSGAPGWLWLTTGLAIGLFVAFLVYLQGRPAAVKQQAVKQAPPHAVKAEKPKADRAKPAASGGDKPRFEFYTLLPEMEVVVPEPDNGRADDDKAPPAKITAAGTYALQAGSFRRFQDADGRKAALALLGIESEIQKVTLDNDETWHRVRIGPYKDLAELNSVRSLLRQNKIDTLLVRIRGES